MDTVQDRLDISTAAAQMGITPEAIRKRIARGTLEATKEDGRWYVIPDSRNNHRQDAGEDTRQDAGQDARRHVQDDRPDDRDRLIQTLTDELEARRREVSELHVLLQLSTQAALAAPKSRPWWRLW